MLQSNSEFLIRRRSPNVTIEFGVPGFGFYSLSPNTPERSEALLVHCSSTKIRRLQSFAVLKRCSYTKSEIEFVRILLKSISSQCFCLQIEIVFGVQQVNRNNNWYSEVKIGTQWHSWNRNSRLVS